jgi:hypothetical protein
MRRITDKLFIYTPSHETDLKKKFAKIIAEQKKIAALEAKFPSNVQKIKREAKA